MTAVTTSAYGTSGFTVFSDRCVTVEAALTIPSMAAQMSGSVRNATSAVSSPLQQRAGQIILDRLYILHF